MDKYLPFTIDVDTLYTVHRITGTQYGILRLLIESFWKSGVPVPLSRDNECCRVARIHPIVWAKHKRVVRDIMEKIFPKIEKEYIKQLNKHKRASEVGRMIGAKTHERNFAKIRRKQALSDADSSHGKITPVPPPRKPFNEGMSDQHARAKAIQANKSPDKPLFTDA